jgi:hypothetical protein
VVEQTGKKWKAIQLLGALGAIAGTIVTFRGLAPNDDGGQSAPTAGFLILVAGLLVFLFGRLGGWWYHG